MHDPRLITIDDYDYHLPDEQVAKYPLAERDASKLLVYRDGRCQQRVFRELAQELPEGSMLVFNDTRVIHARLQLSLDNAARLEIFCLEPHLPADYQLNFSSTQSVQWVCLLGGNRKWKSGQAQLTLGQGHQSACLSVARGERQPDGSFIVTFSWDNPSLSFGELLAAAGLIPLPPYLNREAEATDEDRYQTIYAREQGSVAAPTAGLHFTERVFAQLDARGIAREFVTLHVGAGTFKPVKSERLGEHDMHRETIWIRRELILKLKHQLEKGLPIIAVGTTSLRTLESLYWYGVQCAQAGAQAPEEIAISQWEAYDHPSQHISALQALDAALARIGQRDDVHGQTQILIGPGYTYRLIDGLITNFHQPRSTLLLLVAALVGSSWRHIYDFAQKHQFRFLSYGDSSLLWKSKLD